MLYALVATVTLNEARTHAVPVRQLISGICLTSTYFKHATTRLVTELIMAPPCADDMVHQTGGRAYNGMHLRVEADANTMLKRQEVGGRSAAWDLYHRAAAEAGFTPSTPVVSLPFILMGAGHYCRFTARPATAAVELGQKLGIWLLCTAFLTHGVLMRISEPSFKA